MKLISNYLDNTFSFAFRGERRITPSYLVELGIKQQIGRREHTAGDNLCYSELAEYRPGVAEVGERVVDKDIKPDFFLSISAVTTERTQTIGAD